MTRTSSIWIDLFITLSLTAMNSMNSKAGRKCRGGCNSPRCRLWLWELPLPFIAWAFWSTSYLYLQFYPFVCWKSENHSDVILQQSFAHTVPWKLWAMEPLLYTDKEMKKTKSDLVRCLATAATSLHLCTDSACVCCCSEVMNTVLPKDAPLNWCLVDDSEECRMPFCS